MAVFAAQRVGSAAVFDPQFASAAPAPTGVITSIVVSGQTVTVSGTTANVPASGLATIPAATTPNGAVSQGPSAVTLAGGTFTIAFAAVPPGNYAAPVVTLTNANGTATATGGSAFEVLGVDGEPEAPGPVAFTPVGLTAAVNVGSVTWAYVPPEVPAYTLTPMGRNVLVQVGSAAFSYTPPAPTNYVFTPVGRNVLVQVGSVSWSYWPPSDDDGWLVSMAEADAYVRDLYGSGAPWFSATGEAKAIAIRQASQYLLTAYCIKPEYLDPVHKRVREACCEAAVRALAGRLFADVAPAAVKSEKVGPLEMVYGDVRNGGQQRIAVIDALLRGMTCNTRGMVRLVRA